MTTTLLIVGLAALLTGCGKGGYASNDNNNASGNQIQSTKDFSQQDLEMIANSDAQDAAAQYVGLNLTTAATATSSLKISLAGIGDLASEFDSDFSSCATVSGMPPFLATITYACPKVTGSISSSFMMMMSSSRSVHLHVEGASSSADLKHDWTSTMMSPSATRAIDDALKIGEDTYTIKGSATVTSGSGTIALAGSYDVVKDDGDVITITIASDGVLYNSASTPQVCGGSISYSASNGLAYVKALPACTVSAPVMPPIIIVPPMIPAPPVFDPAA